MLRGGCYEGVGGTGVGKERINIYSEETTRGNELLFIFISSFCKKKKPGVAFCHL